MLLRLQTHYNNIHSYLQLSALDNFARVFLFSLFVKIGIKKSFSVVFKYYSQLLFQITGYIFQYIP